MENTEAKVFSIPVEYTFWEKVLVKANSIEEAIQWIKDNKEIISINPDEGEYIDGSYVISGEDEYSDDNDLIKYLKDYYDHSGGISGESPELYTYDSNVIDITKNKEENREKNE